MCYNFWQWKNIAIKHEPTLATASFTTLSNCSAPNRDVMWIPLTLQNRSSERTLKPLFPGYSSIRWRLSWECVHFSFSTFSLMYSSIPSKPAISVADCWGERDCCFDEGGLGKWSYAKLIHSAITVILGVRSIGYSAVRGRSIAQLPIRAQFGIWFGRNIHGPRLASWHE